MRFGLGGHVGQVAAGTLASLLAAAVLVAPAGGDPAPAAAQAQAPTLTIYSSLPLQGVAFEQTRAVVNGAELALAQAGGRAGPFSVRYLSLDDSTAQARTWDPGRVSVNARRAADDRAAIGYIGEFNSGASAISIPILNEAALAQVSPSNTYTGLTADEPGSDRGEPDKYYPTGRRHYARIQPRDTVQGEALGLLMTQSRCRRVFVIHDGETYGRGLALNVRSAARRRGLRVVGFRRVSGRVASYKAVATRVRRARARCAFFGGITANGAVQLFRDLTRAVPRVRLFAGDGVAESGFVDPREGGVPPRIAARVRLTVSTLAPRSYPPAGRQFFRDYRAKYGARALDPYAIYGYEAMSLLLDSIRRAGPAGSQRQAVVDALFATRDRQSVLGTYSLDARGDTTLTDYGVYRIRRGALEFDRVVRPSQ